MIQHQTMKTREVMALLRVSDPDTIYAMVLKLGGFRVGRGRGQWRFPRTCVEAFIHGGNSRPVARRADSPRAKPAKLPAVPQYVT